MYVEPSPSELAKALQAAKAQQAANRYYLQNRREFPPDWYTWQRQGFESHLPEAMTLAGNQTGKTWSGAYHFALDATGDYPADWKGYRFDIPLNALIIGVDTTQLEVLQSNLFGQVIEEGGRRTFEGGWIHTDEVLEIEWSKASRSLAKVVKVRSRFGTTRIHLRQFTQAKTGQGTLSFAGFVYDLIWADEQPPDELIGQLMVRLTNGNRGRGGRIRFTMTPELGPTDLIVQYTENIGPHQLLVGPVSWDECGHITAEIQERILQAIPDHEHDMRRSGQPYMGGGLIYPVPDSRIKVDPFEIPSYFRVLRSADLGIEHPAATCWLAYNPEDDTVYLVRTWSESGMSAADHMAASNAMWENSPFVFPPDLDNREKGSGKTTRSFYQRAGLKQTLDFANPDGSRYVEPGIKWILDRMRADTFKVFSVGCDEFWREKRLYHRADGKIVKQHDDVMDAMRYGAVMVPSQGRYLSNMVGQAKHPKVIRALEGKEARPRGQAKVRKGHQRVRR